MNRRENSAFKDVSINTDEPKYVILGAKYLIGKLEEDSREGEFLEGEDTFFYSEEVEDTSNSSDLSILLKYSEYHNICLQLDETDAEDLREKYGGTQEDLDLLRCIRDIFSVHEPTKHHPLIAIIGKESEIFDQSLDVPIFSGINDFFRDALEEESYSEIENSEYIPKEESSNSFCLIDIQSDISISESYVEAIISHESVSIDSHKSVIEENYETQPCRAFFSFEIDRDSDDLIVKKEIDCQFQPYNIVVKPHAPLASLPIIFGEDYPIDAGFDLEVFLKLLETSRNQSTQTAPTQPPTRRRILQRLTKPFRQALQRVRQSNILFSLSLIGLKQPTTLVGRNDFPAQLNTPAAGSFVATYSLQAPLNTYTNGRIFILEFGAFSPPLLLPAVGFLAPAYSQTTSNGLTATEQIVAIPNSGDLSPVEVMPFIQDVLREFVSASSFVGEADIEVSLSSPARHDEGVLQAAAVAPALLLASSGSNESAAEDSTGGSSESALGDSIGGSSESA